MGDESPFTIRVVGSHISDIKHTSDVALHLVGWQTWAPSGEPSGRVPSPGEIRPSQKSLLGQQSFVRVSKIQESTCDGSANGAAPAVPQLSYSEMKDGRVTLSPCSGLFILEDETPTNRLTLTSCYPFSVPTHLQTSLPGITSSRLQGQRLSSPSSITSSSPRWETSIFLPSGQNTCCFLFLLCNQVGPECLSDQSDRMALLLNSASISGFSSRLTTEEMNRSKSETKHKRQTFARHHFRFSFLPRQTFPTWTNIHKARLQRMFV